MSSEAMTKGFTLVEILVVLTLLSVVMLVSTSATIKVIRDAQKATIKNEINQNGQRILEDLGREIRAASCVKIDSVSQITTYTEPNCLQNLAINVRYIWSVGTLSKVNVKTGISSLLLPSDYAMCGCNDSSGCTSGFSVTAGAGDITKSNPANVQLTIRYKNNAYGLGTDTCTVLSDVFVPRN